MTPVLVPSPPMTFWQALKATYSGGTRFLLACPLLAAVPMVFELAQHIAEVAVGMYDSLAAAKAVENHPLRLGLGIAKMAALLLTNYWIVRWMATGSPRFAARLDPLAVRLFGAAFGFIMLLSIAQLFLLPTDNTAIFAAGFVGGQILGVLIAAWVAGAALGNRAIGPMASVRLMAPVLPFTFALFTAAMLPLMIPHYALAALAILGPKALLWPSLIVDTVLVGWLSAIMAASGYVGAARAAARAATGLMPQQPQGESALSTRSAEPA